MEPGNDRGPGSSGGAVAAAVMVMVTFGGGMSRPLVTHQPHVAMTQAPRAQG